MDDSESVAHAKWEGKYHVVWIPRYRRKALYGELRKHLGPVLRELARQRECVVEAGHLNLDHVHMLLSIPPKVRGGPGPRVYQGGERHPHCAHLPRAAPELHGATLLGPRVLRVYRRS